MVGVRQAYHHTVNGRLKKGRPATEKELKWSCPACSFLNHTLINYCEICETRRKDSDEEDELEGLSRAHLLHSTSDAAATSRASAGSSPSWQATSYRAGATADSTMDEGFYAEHMPMLLEMFASLGEDVVHAVCVELEADGVQDMDICVRQLLERSNSTEADGAAVQSAGTSSPQHAPMSLEETPSEDLRACPLCSFLNPVSRTACEICEAVCLPPVATQGAAALSTPTASEQHRAALSSRSVPVNTSSGSVASSPSSSSKLRSNNSGNAAAPKRSATAGKKKPQADRNSARERKDAAAQSRHLTLAEEDEFVTPESSPRQKARLLAGQSHKDHAHAASADSSAAGNGSAGVGNRGAPVSPALSVSPVSPALSVAPGSPALSSAGRTGGRGRGLGGRTGGGRTSVGKGAGRTGGASGYMSPEQQVCVQCKEIGDQIVAAGSADTEGSSTAANRAGSESGEVADSSEVSHTNVASTSRARNQDAVVDALAADGTATTDDNMVNLVSEVHPASGTAISSASASRSATGSAAVRPLGARSSAAGKLEHRSSPAQSTSPGSTGDAASATKNKSVNKQPSVQPLATADDKERQLLLSMGWVPDDDDDEGGLEEWEIDAAQESFIEHLQGQPREGLRERAQREFEAWKAEQTARESPMEPSVGVIDSRAPPASGGNTPGSNLPSGRAASSSTSVADVARRAGQRTSRKHASH